MLCPTVSSPFAVARVVSLEWSVEEPLEQKYSWCLVPEIVPVGFILGEKPAEQDASHCSSCTSALLLTFEAVYRGQFDREAGSSGNRLVAELSAK
jgi:hypothetical protein